MIIEKIVLGKYKCIITLNDGNTIKVNYETVVNFGFRKGDPLDEDRLALLMREDETLNCKNSIYRMIGRRQHSRFELYRKLTEKGYNRSVVNDCLDFVEESGYIDDKRFTEIFVEEKYFNRKLGINRLRAELKKKGIKEEIISEVLSSVCDDEQSLQNALILGKKKKESLEKRSDDTQKIKNSVYRHLISKGFSYEIARRIVDSLFI